MLNGLGGPNPHGLGAAGVAADLRAQRRASIGMTLFTPRLSAACRLAWLSAHAELSALGLGYGAVTCRSSNRTLVYETGAG